MDNNMDKMLDHFEFRNHDKKRAAQILDAVQGMEVHEAQELLELCSRALMTVKVTY